MPQLVDKKNFKGLFIVIDLGLIYISFVIAFLLRYSEIPERNWAAFMSISPWLVAISILFLSIYEIYAINRKNVWDIIRSIFVASTFISTITMSVTFLFREFALPRSVLLLAYLIMIVLLVSWKILFVRMKQRNRVGKVLLIANDEESNKIMHQVMNSYGKGTQITLVDPDAELTKMNEYIKSQDIDHILISSNVNEDKKSRIIYQAMKRNKVIYVIPSLYDLLLSKSIITSVDETMVLAVKPFGLTYDERFVKRIFDIVVSFLGIIILLPINLLVALIVKLESPSSPVVYRQSRLGKDNKEFTLYKFRSMVNDAEKDTGPILASKHDIRITTVGRFIRSTRLDEIPQLVNVLKGDMSLVGPRPEREHFISILSKQHKSYQYRNTVKPGITGYAQVMGSYSANVMDKLRFDLYYIRNYSLWLDIVIILRTLIVIIDSKKAEGYVPPEVAPSGFIEIKKKIVTK